MAFIPDFPTNATLIDVFRAFPTTSKPLLQYHEALMRGPSPLSEAERELIAAYVSGLNACNYCHGVHTATAAAYGVPESTLAALLDDVATAPVDDKLKPILAYVRKLTLTPARMTEADATAVYAASWSPQALHDAASVCGVFNLMNRLVDGLGLKGDAPYFSSAAKRLRGAGGYGGIVERLKL